MQTYNSYDGHVQQHEEDHQGDRPQDHEQWETGDPFLLGDKFCRVGVIGIDGEIGIGSA